MFILKGLHRTVLPWLGLVVFAGNFLCSDALLNLPWPFVGTASEERASQVPEATSLDETHDRLTFGVAPAQAASTDAKE
jgi:hypothetical protein